jgi:hypothetical protein
MASLGHNTIAKYVGRTRTPFLGIRFIRVYLSVLGILGLGIGSTMNRELALLSAFEGSAGAQRDVVRTLEVICWGIAIFAGGVVILLAPYITWGSPRSSPPWSARFSCSRFCLS